MFWAGRVNLISSKPYVHRLACVIVGKVKKGDATNCSFVSPDHVDVVTISSVVAKSVAGSGSLWGMQR